MTTVLIEALAGGIKDAPIFLEAGERKAVSSEKAKLYCGAGWAIAVDGSIDTAEPVPGAVALQPGDIEQASGQG